MFYNKLLELIYTLSGKTTKYDAWQKYQTLIKNQWLSRGELEKLQWKKLKALLVYSYNNIPFYRKKFDIANLKPENINNPEDFFLIPVTTKEELLKESHPLNPDLSSKNLEWIQTSGTTGNPLSWPFDIASYNTKYALFLRGYSFMDWKLGDRIASLWWPGHSSYHDESFAGIKRLVYFFAHRRRLYPPITTNSTDIDLKPAKHLYNNLKWCPPHVFETSVENLLFLSYFMEENKLPPLKIKNISAAGLLTENSRKRFETYYQGAIYNRYGPHEMEGIAHECSAHQGLHLSSDSYYLECVKETGEFILTDLDNYTQPFIRYKIGDSGSFSEKQCPCGRGLPLINYLEGRTEDFLLNEKGKKISPLYVIKLFEKYPEIKFFQFIQSNLLKFQLFLVMKNEVYIDSSSKFTESPILYDLMNILGPSVKIEIKFTKAIPAEASGKFRWVKNNIIM